MELDTLTRAMLCPFDCPSLSYRFLLAMPYLIFGTIIMGIGQWCFCFRSDCSWRFRIGMYLIGWIVGGFLIAHGACILLALNEYAEGLWNTQRQH